jgi:hypothetical protein
VPGALRSIASVWRTGLSKVQVLMERLSGLFQDPHHERKE